MQTTTTPPPQPVVTNPPAYTPSQLTPPSVVLPTPWARTFKVLMALGVLLTLLGFALSHDSAVRTAASVLLASQFVLGLSLGGIVFVAVAYVTSAGWHVAFRRVPEAMAGSMVVGVGTTIVAVACMHWLYEWSHASHMEADALLQSKAWWLNTGGFIVRTAIYLVLWVAFTQVIRRISRRQDETAEVDATRRNARLSAIFLVVFALSFTAATFDWLMSLQPHWYSTVFAMYQFAGLFSSALATMLILLIVLRRMGKLSVLTDEHLHDLGKLTLSFATFWGYLWFCQFMLIWYGNLPEETVFYVVRQEGAWSVLHVLNPIVNWMIPFIVLLPRPAKRSESILLRVAALLLIGRWLDLFTIINPNFMPAGPVVGFWEIGPLLIALPLFPLVFFRVLGRGRLVPEGDPSLAESLHHRT